MTRRATGKSYGNTERKISHAESTMIRQNYYSPLFRRSWTLLTCDYEIRILQRSGIKFHEKNQHRHTIFHSPLFFIRPLNWPFQLSFDICNTIVCFLLAFEYLFNDLIISIGRPILLKKKKEKKKEKIIKRYCITCDTRKRLGSQSKSSRNLCSQVCLMFAEVHTWWLQYESRSLAGRLGGKPGHWWFSADSRRPDDKTRFLKGAFVAQPLPRTITRK